MIVIAVVRFIPAFNSIITSLFYLRILEPSADIIFDEIKIDNLQNFSSQAKVVKKKFNKNLIILKDISFSYEGNKQN